MSLYVKAKKKFRGFTLDIEIDSKERDLSIMGPSGSGKSMTLRCIAGLIKPDEGIVRIGDNVVFDSEKRINILPRNRKIGFLFQNYALFPNMTVKENIEFGLDKKDGEGKEFMDRIIKKFKIDDLMDRKPHQLSGGQQQRVALARVLVPRPQILLLDEPFSALDEFLKLSLMKEMRDALKEFELNSVFVTHNIHEAYQMSSELAIYYSGKIISEGNREEIFNYPKNAEAARITGCKNIYDAELISVDESINPAVLNTHISEIKAKAVRVRIPGLGIEADCTKVSDGNVPDKGKTFIRANHIKISKYDETLGESGLRAMKHSYIADVEHILPSPFRVTVYMKIKGEGLIQAELSRDNWQHIQGDKVVVTLPIEKLIYA